MPGCGWGGSNSQGLAPSTFRTYRVYQFHHTRDLVLALGGSGCRDASSQRAMPLAGGKWRRKSGNEGRSRAHRYNSTRLRMPFTPFRATVQKGRGNPRPFWFVAVKPRDTLGMFLYDIRTPGPSQCQGADGEIRTPTSFRSTHSECAASTSSATPATMLWHSGVPVAATRSHNVPCRWREESGEEGRTTRVGCALSGTMQRGHASPSLRSG